MRCNAALFLQVDTNSNLLSVHPSETEEGKIEYTRIGNLKDVQRLEIEGVADLKLGEGGDVLWAFVDTDEPLVISPGAFLSKDDQVRINLADLDGIRLRFDLENFAATPLPVVFTVPPRKEKKEMQGYALLERSLHVNTLAFT
jgi:hypothetical protein